MNTTHTVRMHSVSDVKNTIQRILFEIRNEMEDTTGITQEKKQIIISKFHAQLFVRLTCHYSQLEITRFLTTEKVWYEKRRQKYERKGAIL